ncbi:MAG: nickel-dependent lactate racemase [Anaerolineales bacterium]|nr:nickel-dependent lactate racemase [Anaerolineales bacterium]
MRSTTLQLAYGDGSLSVEIPPANLLGVIHPIQAAEPGEKPDGAAILCAALAHPIGTPLLRQIVKPGQKIVIVTSDMTRPCPSDKLLPPVIAELEAAGIPDGDITIVLALGLHRPMSEAEIDQALSPVMRRRFRVLNHDAGDCVRLGVTPAGTPVEFFRPVVEADVRICLGNLEFHYFAGYSGGAKAILPGCASKATVTANHAMMVHPLAASGVIEGNPLRADLEQGVALLGVDFILNAVVDSQHNVLSAVAGDVIAAHRQGCQQIAARGKVKIPRRADIVLASAGGFPKDINFYQAHKALESAKLAVRDGGALILVAECPEHIGHPVFERWMLEAASPQEILERIRREFVLGGHKAAAIAAIESRADLYLVSAMPEALARRLFTTPFASPQQALEAALEKLGANSQVLVLPQAGSVLPDV